MWIIVITIIITLAAIITVEIWPMSRDVGMQALGIRRNFAKASDNLAPTIVSDCVRLG